MHGHVVIAARFFAGLFLISLFAYAAFLIVEFGPAIGLHGDLQRGEAGLLDMGSRSQYLNFMIGIPVAIVGVAATALLAFVGNELVKRQAQMQATELADAKVTRELHTFIALINAFDEAIEVGDEIKTDLIPRLIQDCQGKDVRPIEVLDFEEAAYDPENEKFPFSDDDARPEIVELRRKWAPLFIRVGKTVERDMEEIFTGYQKLTMDPFWSAALSLQIGDATSKFSDPETQWARPLSTVYQEMGDHELAAALKSPRALGRELRYIAKNAKAWQSIHAFLFTPKDATPLEFVGAILSLTDRHGTPAATAYSQGRKQNKSLAANRGHPIEELKLYNVAAAMLISLYKALPAKAAIEMAVDNLFPEAGKDASYDYFHALPNKRKVTSDALLDMIDELYERPTQLIYSENLVGERRATIRNDDLDKTHTRRGLLSGRGWPLRVKQKPAQTASAVSASAQGALSERELQELKDTSLPRPMSQNSTGKPIALAG